MKRKFLKIYIYIAQELNAKFKKVPNQYFLLTDHIGA